MSKKMEEEEPQSAPEWLVTFSDMVGLLCTFFIMMLTFSTSEKERFAKMAGSLSGQFGLIADPKIGRNESSMPTPPNIKNRVTEDGFKKASEGLDLIKEGLKTLVREVGNGNRIDFDQTNDGKRLAITCPTPFPPGSSFLTHDVREVLRELADLLRLHSQKVMVIAHAWNEGGEFDTPAKLEQLTAERALAAAEFLISTGRIPSSRVLVGARGSQEPREAGYGDVATAANRRFEILVLPPDA
jgi:chemotaxis protein MotB